MEKYYISLILLLLFIFILPSGLAADLQVEKTEIDPVIIVEIDKPAKFTLSIINNDITDSFEIYSLVGVYLTPSAPFSINAGETKELELVVNPHPETKRDFRGIYIVDYEIKGLTTGFFKDKLKIKIVELKDAVQIEIVNIAPDDEQAQLIIKNPENFNFEEVAITIESVFFEFSDTVSLAPFEEVNFSLPINKNEIKGLVAGEYEIDITINIEAENITVETQGLINYLEKGGLSAKTESKGFIIRKKTTTKINEGNVPIVAEITDKKDIISRLFTTHSEKPTTSERKGFFIEYKWEKQLEPEQVLSITSTTNYTIPFILLIIIILVVIIVRIYLHRNLTLDKRVSFVKTKGGEFALKVRLRVKARKSLDNVQIIDIIPRSTKLYERFGTKPEKIDEKTRRVFKNINKT